MPPLYMAAAAALRANATRRGSGRARNARPTRDALAELGARVREARQAPGAEFSPSSGGGVVKYRIEGGRILEAPPPTFGVGGLVQLLGRARALATRSHSGAGSNGGARPRVRSSALASSTGLLAGGWLAGRHGATRRNATRRNATQRNAKLIYLELARKETEWANERAQNFARAQGGGPVAGPAPQASHRHSPPLCRSSA